MHKASAAAAARLPVIPPARNLARKQLALTAKWLVGMARAPVGSGRAEAALLSKEQVKGEEGGQPWTVASATVLYRAMQGCGERASRTAGCTRRGSVGMMLAGIYSTE